jgi:hypothetical protein
MIDIISRLARMNEPLTKRGIKELINELIYNTASEEAFRIYIAAHGIVKEADEPLVGESWYQNFINRNDDVLKCGKVCIQDHQ